MRTVIIDDAEKARSALKGDLRTYCPEVQLIGEADSVISGVELIEKMKPELVLLDIRMGDGTGFDLLEYWKQKGEVPFQVIFTTAYNEYAIKAFKFSATDYLLKPVDPGELKEAVQRVQQQKQPIENTTQLHFLLDSLKDLKASTKRIALSGAEKVQIVAVAEIIRCESEGNYTLFILTENRRILVSKTLKDYDELLEEFGFLRVHHSHLINLHHLKEYVKTEGGYAVMSDRSQVPVSVRKKEHLYKILGL